MHKHVCMYSFSKYVYEIFCMVHINIIYIVCVVHINIINII